LDHVSLIASSVSGVEERHDRFSKCPYPTVILGDVLSVQMPEADVYWWWFGGESLSLKLVDRLPSGADLIFDVGGWNLIEEMWEQPTRTQMIPRPSRELIAYAEDKLGFPVEYMPYYWEEDEDDVGCWSNGEKAEWHGWRGIWIGVKP